MYWRLVTGRVRIVFEAVVAEMYLNGLNGLNGPVPHDSEVLSRANFVSCNSVYTMRIECSKENECDVIEGNSTLQFCLRETVGIKGYFKLRQIC